MSTSATDSDTRRLISRGIRLEWFTLGWNLVGVCVLAVLAITASSVALAGFGLDSVIEIGASTVVLWDLTGADPLRQRRALRMVGVAFVALACYSLVQSSVVLIAQHHAIPSIAGIIWTAITAATMFALAAGKARTGRALRNPVLTAEGRVTFIDGMLAVAVLLGLALDWSFGWWWADPTAGFVIAYYAVREAINIFAADGHQS